MTLFADHSYKLVKCLTGIFTRSFPLSALLLSGCAGYQNPPGKWLEINASSLFFSGIELKDEAITSGYKDTCQEARDEVEKVLINKLPAKISPLNLHSANNPPASNKKIAELKIHITQCDIDSDQSGGNFTYYLSLPLRVTLTLDGQTLLDYSVQTYEQIQVSVPSPLYEFTFAEAENRVLQLFNGNKVWIAETSSAEK